ncbi:MAG: methyltransferase domain-containing protein [Gemmatirosa sp.]|nr:methyltransferase domain-containing protein [Gemmatirosa sp.]
MTTVPVDEAYAAGERESWLDAALRWRDTLTASAAFQRWAARFPLTRPIARRRSRALFDLCAGFVYTQVLRACVELDLFGLLAAAGPLAPDAIAARVGLAPPALERLIGAAIALRLLERRTRGRVGLGPLGAPLAGNEALDALVRHHALLYDDLRDPVALLRRRAQGGTALADYYPYAGTADVAPAQAATYSALMSATAAPLIEEVLDAVPLGRRHTLLDVGGGEGRLAMAAAARWPHLSAVVLDLPPVAERARQAVAARGLGGRVTAVGADFQRAPLPAGADVVTLMRVLLDHPDDVVLALLRRVRAALADGGQLVIVEPLAGVRGARVVGDAYFALYLYAMGGGRARTEAELRALCASAGFARCRRVWTRYPVSAGILIAEV